MKLAEQSTSTRKQSATKEQRVAKRREAWPILDGYGPVVVDGLGGTAQIVTHAKRGGVFVEYGEDTGTFHAVPIEAAAALGFSDPVPQGAASPEPQPEKKAEKPAAKK